LTGLTPSLIRSQVCFLSFLPRCTIKRCLIRQFSPSVALAESIKLSHHSFDIYSLCHILPMSALASWPTCQHAYNVLGLLSV